MWKVEAIHVKNICTLKSLDYSLNQGVTTLVYGENKDNDSQKSNGSGKSALIEAIAFGLTGTPLRNIKNDELINNDEESAFIEIFLKNTSSNDKVIIYRQISRKSPAIVTVQLYRDDILVDDGTTIKSGVDEYNKYILDIIGLTKDEIYSNFILSKHKYEDFLSASDKDKKEIINKFSRGNLVDQSIEALQLDKKPIQENLTNKLLELSNIDGRISALEEQVENEKANLETKASNKTIRIEKSKEGIKETKNEILSLIKSAETLKISNDRIIEMSEKLNDLDEEHNKYSLDDVIRKIEAFLLDCKTLAFSLDNYRTKKDDIANQSEKLKSDIDLYKNRNLQLIDQVKTANKLQKKCSIDYDIAKKALDEYAAKIKNEATSSKLDEKKISDSIAMLRSDMNNNNVTIASLEAKVSGAIECPHCNKLFILKDHNFDVESGKNKIICLKNNNADIELKIQSFTSESEKIRAKIESLRIEYREENSKYYDIQATSDEANRNYIKLANDLKSNEDKIESLENRLDSLNEKPKKIAEEIFDDLFESLDRVIAKNKSSIKATSEFIANKEGIIKAKEELISKLESEKDEDVIISLQLSIKEYKKKRAFVYRDHVELDDQIKQFESQEARFIAFKTYLANSKIEALNTITNDFLEQIGSDLQVQFDGYTMLKSGKIRDKISVSLLRDGIDAGSFSKFSEGEKSRIQLATILAMNSLTNNNADGDKGLDLLVLDEILSAVDEEGLSSILSSLNKLKITSIVVSHGKTAESYPHKLIITKQNGISTI